MNALNDAVKGLSANVVSIINALISSFATGVGLICLNYLKEYFISIIIKYGIRTFTNLN